MSGTETITVTNTVNPQITLDSQIESVKVSALLQGYPNPANNGCYIPFKLSQDSNVSLEVYNILGQKVRTIEVGQKPKGSYTKQDRAIFWDLK